MKSIKILGLLILVASLAVGGITNPASAQEDPQILVKIAKRAQDQIQKQITDESPISIKELFQEGKNKVSSLETSLSNNDYTTAREDFLAAMKIFSEVSHQLSDQSAQNQVASKSTPNPSNDLLRLYSYVNNLKNIARNHNSTINFDYLDGLFVTSKNQIQNNQFAQASQTIHEIKQTIIEINAELREEASQKELSRAQVFAQKYLKQIDRLIEHSQSTGVSQEIIQKFKAARENLSVASTPSQVIQEVRNTMILQQQYELTENKLLQLRVDQIEKTLDSISTELDENSLQELKESLQAIKTSISKSDFEEANKLLRSITSTLEQIQIQ
ncbi:MAG: hypothetical protein ACE5RI_00660 [Candidatus Nitrosomaritimum yanchengensis]